MEHSSSIDATAKRPFLASWRNGEIQSVYIDSSESISSANLKRGLVSLFQYRTLDDEVRERDASGLCDVVYVSAGINSIEKQKTACNHSTLPPKSQHPNPVFAVNLNSQRNSKYVLANSLLPETILDYEHHIMTLASKMDVGSIVTSERRLTQVSSISSNVHQIIANTVHNAVASLHPECQETSIELQQEPSVCADTGCPTVSFYLYWRMYFFNIIK